MKYGIVISVSQTRFGPIVLREDLEVNIKKAAEIGYGGIELAIRKPDTIDIGQIDRLIKKYNLKIFLH